MFALGIVLFSTLPNYVADLLSYLIGDVLAITVADLVQVVVLGAGILLVVVLLRKELLFATFDPPGRPPPACRWLPLSTDCLRCSG